MATLAAQDERPGRRTRPWWRVAPTDRRGLGILVGAYVVYTAIWCGVGELIVRWWDDSSFGDADTAVNRWLERHRTDTLTELAHFGSALSNTETKIVLVLGLLPLMLVLYRRWHDWAFITLSLLLEVAVFGTTATLIGRPRPPVEQLDGAPTDSWPSGHIAASVVFYVGLAMVLMWNNRCRSTRVVALCIGIGAPTAVTASRLYLGMHHPTDVVGGVVLGLVALGTVRHVLRRTAGDTLEHPVTHEVPCDDDAIEDAAGPDHVTSVDTSAVSRPASLGTAGSDAALTTVGGRDERRTR